MPEVMEPPAAAPAPTTITPSTPAPAPESDPRSAAQRITAKAFRREEPKAPEPKPEPKPEPPQAKPEPPKTAEKPQEKPVETTTKPAETKVEAPVEKGKKTPWQIVHERDDQIKVLTKQLEELQGKSVEDHPKYKELSAAVEASKKQAEEALEKLRFRAYEDHPEFKEKYVEPYESAWNTGRERISKLTLTDADGNTRKGTAQDWDSLYQLRLSDPDQAAEIMGTMFGVKAAAVEAQMLSVDERLNAMQSARERFKKEGMARIKQEQEQRSSSMKAMGEQISKSFQTHYDAIPKEHPELFNEVEGDEKGNTALKAGYDAARRAFAQLNLADPNLTPEQREQVIRLHAETLHYAAASRRLIEWRQADQALIAELKAKIAEYEKSEPGGGDGGQQKEQEEGMVSRVEKRLRMSRRI